MRTIANDIENEIIIKKSKFICHLYRVHDISDITKKLDYINAKYSDATHNCYAYICGNLKKMSDDKEPSGTAGMPMLNLLEINNLNNILAIVTRYFGGIKLGANGLVRAYADSVKEALNKAEIINLIPGLKIKIEFNYDNIKQIDYILKEYDIEKKEFANTIFYTINIGSNDYIKDKLNKYIISYKELSNILITQKEE